MHGAANAHPLHPALRYCHPPGWMKTLIAFTAAYTVGLFAYGQVVESPLAILYTAITIGLFALFAVLHRLANWPLRSLWAASLVGLGNMLGGVLLLEGRPLYVVDLSPFPNYDKIFHTVAGAAMFVVAWEAMKHWAGDGHRFGGLLLATWLVTMGGGAVVEVAEFVGSLVGDVNVGDYENNVLDIVANGLGASVGALYVTRRDRRMGVAVDP